jgi:serine/threonine-protein kinase
LLLAPDYAADDEDPPLLRESRMAAAIDHRNIIPIYEAGESRRLLRHALRRRSTRDPTARRPLAAKEAVCLLGIRPALMPRTRRGSPRRKPANLLIASGQGRTAMTMSTSPTSG